MDAFAPIDLVTVSDVPVETLEAHIRANSVRGIPFLMDRPFDLKNEPIALVGGGPSLQSTIHELREFKHVMVCGSAFDHVVGLGLKPEYAVFCDQEADMIGYSNLTNCIYLIATQCNPAVVDHFAGHDIRMWDMDGWVDEKTFEGRPRIAGGSTAALRAMSLAFVLGYRDIHLFGVDSSFDDDRGRHAYDYPDEREKVPSIVCRINGRKFRTSLPFLAQAKDFQTVLQSFGHLFAVTVHGDSLLGDVWKDFMSRHDAVFNREKAA